MRPDLIRLLVDEDRKDLINSKSVGSTIQSVKTIDRVGLSKPLSDPEQDWVSLSERILWFEDDCLIEGEERIRI